MTGNDQNSDPLYAPLTEEERLVIRKELRERQWAMRDRDLVNGKEGQKLFAQHHHAVRLAALTVAADHGKAFVRYAVTLNGGAMIALIALIGALYGKADAANFRAVAAFVSKLQIGLYFFIGGLVFAAIIAASAFIQWHAYAQTHFGEGQTANGYSHNNLFGPDSEQEAIAQFERYDRISIGMAYVSIALGAASIFLFVAGCLKITKAFAFLSFLR